MLENAIVYDIESFPNMFSLAMECLNSDTRSIWEISQFRDDREALFTWFNYLNRTQTPMIGFNNLFYDYNVIHWLYKNPQATYADIYAYSMSLINNTNRFGNTIWASDRFAPQIDLFKVFHFDNKAKTTNLKSLQINMRSENVVESAVPFGTWLEQYMIDRDVIPYNVHDTKETKKFARGALSALNFRVAQVPQFGLEVLNWNDTKIGENILIDKIGRDVCMPRGADGKRHKRQTIRDKIALTDVIFPYVSFQNPEFQRVLEYMRAQTLTPDELVTEDGEIIYGDQIKTKGVFSGLKAHVAGLDYHFGTGGIHASVSAQHVRSGNGLIIRDIDVASLYPSIAIVNRLYPEHLGEAFVEAYASLPKERKEWQKKKGKKCTEANALKLAANGAYGKSNDKFSCLFDPLFTMRITINGQLMLAMLVERLVTVPTLQVIQANTDGITYLIHQDYVDQAKQIETEWQAFTMLTLEDAEYSDMWIRDVNNYVARSMDGTLKQKGAYWHPEIGDRYFDSVSEQQPPAWHKDLGGMVIVKAAVAAMVYGADVEAFIRCCTDPYDFCLRIKVGRSDVLTLDGREMQRNTRYFVARDGGRMVKTAPPAQGAAVGSYKRASKISDATWNAVQAELKARGTPDAWDARIHTKNKSKHDMRETQIQAGWLVAECNNIASFDWSRLNYDFYIQEAKKLLIGSHG